MSAPASVAIVGGGIAGVTTARELRGGGFDGSITVVEAGPACYDRPPLSKAAFVDGASLDSLRFATAEEFAAQRIEVVTGNRAIGLAAPGERDGRVTLDDGGTLEAAGIVLATGARARRPAFPGADLPAIGVLRDYADASRLRAAAHPGSTVLVVGAGFIGAELASGLLALGAGVVLADRNAVPGARVLGATLATQLHAMHAAHGVDVRIASVIGAEAADDRVLVRLDDGSTVTADAVVVGVGIEIDTSLAEAAGAEVDGGIVVDEAGRTSVPGIWAVGDATRRRLPGGDLAFGAGHWEAAVLDARGTASAILGGEPAARGASWFWSDRYGIHLEVVGRLVGDGEEVVRRAEPGRPAAVLRVADGRLVGAASIDDPNTVRAARRLIDQRVPVTTTALADPAVSLRDLLRAAR